jgi:hypothetical protein
MDLRGVAQQTVGVDRTATPSLRSLAALITAIAGLITAISALRKPPEEPAAKVSYEAMQKTIDQLNQNDVSLRNDLLAVRNSFAEYVRIKEGASNFVPSVGGATVSVAPSPSVVPTAVATAVGIVPPPSASVVVPVPRQKVVVPTPASSATPPPPLPPFSSIAKQTGSTF